jgi:hypothetical protein
MKRTSKVTNPESGIAMLAALFALLLLTAIAVGMMYMANSESQVNANFKDSERAFWGARAGLEEVRARLFTGKTTSGDLVPLAPATLPGNAGSLLYVARSGVAAPWNQDTKVCTEFIGIVCGAGGLPNSAWVKPVAAVVPSYTPNQLQVGTAPPFEWVRVNLKRNDSNISGTSHYYVEAGGDLTREICWNGASQIVKPITASALLGCNDPTLSPRLTPVYVLEAYAAAPGGATRFAQMEVAATPPFSSNATVDSEDLVVLSGALDISGFDACNCVCAKGSFDPAKQFDTECDVANITTRPGSPVACDKSKWAIYSKSTITQNGSGTLWAGSGDTLATATSANNDCSSGDPTKCFPYDIAALIDTYKTNAVDGTAACLASGSTTCGPSTFHLTGGNIGGTMPSPFPPDYSAGQTEGVPQTTYFSGDVQLNAGSSGNGILIVDGDLNINGGFQWYGLILVKGIVDFTGGGANQNIWGAVLNGTSVSKDDKLGGSSTIAYDSCALKNTQQTQPPKMLSFREITY